jgi:hypothetical protein
LLLLLAASFAIVLVARPRAQDPPRPPDPAQPSYAQLAWASFIVFDMSGDGMALTSMVDGVSFDMSGTGTTDKIGWTVKGSDDAFLVRDNNGNGRIDSGTEMLGKRFKFGDQVITNGVNTLAYTLQGHTVGPDGRARFEPGRGGDPGVGLDKSDPEFATLRLWTDANHDGHSSPEELRTMSEAGVIEIGTGFRMHSRDPTAIDANGNRKLFSGWLRISQRGVAFQRDLMEFEPARTAGTVPTTSPAVVTPSPARSRQLREDGTSEVLVINLDGRGVCLTSVVDGVLSNPASSTDRNGWTCTGRQDAFVVSDHTRDGRIQGEILGGLMGPPNGLQYLQAVSRSGAAGRRAGQPVAPGLDVIDVHSDIYSSLAVWIDLDHDGQSQEGELQSLAHAGIESISLSMKTVREDVRGNIITGRSVAKLRGSGGLEDREIITVRLAMSK